MATGGVASSVQVAERESDFVPTLMLILWCFIAMFLWFFAFYRGGAEGAPEWLVRAQAVCFGITETGLPEKYGWYVLIFAPLSFLFALLVAYGRDIISDLSVRLHTGLGKAVFVVIASAMIVEGGWVGLRLQEGYALLNKSYEFTSEKSLPEDYPVLNKPAPAFELVNQRGEKIRLQDFTDGPTLLTFAFAHCTTVCPAIVDSVNKAAQEAAAVNGSVLIITLDPWRDTPGSLPDLARRWNLGDNVHILSGPVDEVNAVLASYNVGQTRDDKTGDVVHPALVYTISPDQRIAYALLSPPKEWLVAAVRRTATMRVEVG